MDMLPGICTEKPFQIAIWIFNVINSSKLCFGVSDYSLPLEGGGLGRGCSMEIIFNTLPLIPSPRGRGFLRYLAALLQGSSFNWFWFINDEKFFLPFLCDSVSLWLKMSFFQFNRERDIIDIAEND